MVRRILCFECGSSAHLHAEDIDLGWEQRKVQGVALKPVLLCDQCSIELREGTFITAVTRWRHEDSPLDWEREYLIPANSADRPERPADEPFFDIDTDIRPDTDPTIFHRRPLHAQDEGGEYGSVFDTEEVTEIPEPE